MHRTPHSREAGGDGRTWRRWKRRARLAAPFLSIPLLLGALVLSVDLIEYQPDEEAETSRRERAPSARESKRPESRVDTRERRPELGAAISRSSVVEDPRIRLETWEPEVPEALSFETRMAPGDFGANGRTRVADR